MRSKVPFAGALLVALLAGLALWSLLRPPPQARTRAASPPPAVPGPASPDAGPGPQAPVAGPARPARTRAAPGQAPAPEPAPPAEPAATAGELRARLAALHVEVPYGTLEVLVLDGERPLAGARVLVHGRLLGGAPRELTALRGYGFEGRSDERGLVAFRGLTADTYDVRVLAPPRPVLEVTAVHTAELHQRVLAVYGGGSVAGRVLDLDGLPVEGCRISVGSMNALLDGQRGLVWATTDAEGEYLVSGLLAEGTWWVKCACGDEPPETVTIALEFGQQVRVDFGWPGGLPLWTGTVRDAGGAPVEFPGRLALRRLDNGQQTQFDYGADGTFEVPLRPGRYSVSGWGYQGGFVLGELDVPAGGLQRDLELPLTRVEVELIYSGTDPEPRRVLAAVQVWLRETPERGGRLADGVLGERRSFRAVPPGDYYLIASPNPLVGITAQPLAIRPGVALERVRLTVGDR